MKKLLYKGIEFDDFQLYNGDTGDYGDYNSELLDRFNSANIYVCPHCIKRYELYKECGVFKEEIESVINNTEYNGITFGTHHQSIICGVKGCNNPNSYDCMINTEECQLIETKIKEEIIMNNYTWKWSLDEKGFVEVPFHEYTDCQTQKLKYVEKYLSPSIQHSNCGWHHATYYVLRNKLGTEEYVALYPEKENVNGRYINVSGNSLGYVAKAAWNGVFN